MTHYVSIIIPSYNKSLELDLLLYSIERQNYDHSHLEVIVIDDHSTDRTQRKLKSYNPSFRFCYLRNKTHRGRSYTRNRGIKKAKGDILILLDADSIINCDFVTNHVKYHHRTSNLVVTGVMHLDRVYSIYYPNYSKYTHRRIRSLLKKDIDLYERYRPLIKKAITSQRAIRLLSKKDIAIELHKRLSFSGPYFPEIIDKFGCNLENYRLPWTSFLSGNVSFRKELIERVGGFDEGFQGWGFEDWEMGYRMHRSGAKFLADPSVKSYHQEHPVSYEIVNQEMYSNYCYYQQKHPYFETCLHATFLLGTINRIQEHTLVEEYQLLEQLYPGQYMNFIQSLMHLFRLIAVLLKEGYSREKIMNELKHDPLVQQESLAMKERNELAQLERCPTLVWLFDALVNS